MIYFPILDGSERNLPCYLTGIGRQENQEEIIRESDFALYQLLFVTHGSGILEYDQKTIPLSKGNIWFIRKNKPHRYRAVCEPFTTRWISFNGSGIDGLLRYFGLPPILCFTTQRLSLLQAQHQQLMKYTARGVRTGELSALLYRFLTDAFCEIPSSSSCELEPLRTHLCEQYMQDITLDDMAQMVGMSKYALCRLYRREYGVTPFAFLLHVRLQKAKELLAERKDLSVREIGLAVGFRDAVYFGRIFRQREGITPLNFRKKYS